MTRITKSLNSLAAIGVAVSTLLVTISAFMRYVAGKPFHFTEEIGALLFVLISVLSSPYVLTEKRHIRVSILLNRLNPRYRCFLDLFAHVISIIILVVMIKVTLEFSISNYHIGSRSPDADIYLFPWTALVPFSLAMMGIVLIRNVIEILMLIRNRRGCK